MPATGPRKALRDQAVALIRERVAHSSASKVASDLEITRQAVHGYVRGAFCPSLEIIGRACKAWNKEFPVHGFVIDQHSFRENLKFAPLPKQMDLYEALKTKRFKVETRKVGDSMELVLVFRLSA
jgi:hypothetical protein